MVTMTEEAPGPSSGGSVTDTGEGDDVTGIARAGEIAVGDTGPTLVVESVDREDFVRFAGCTGDFNPMHYDDPAAVAAGHDSAFAPGMLTGGYASRLLTNWFGLVAVRRFDVRFHERVWPGDTLTVEGVVVDTRPADGGVVADVEFEVTTQDGSVVVTGSADAFVGE